MDWTALAAETDEQLAALRKAAPETAQAFGALSVAAQADGALATKTKELIALAVAVATKCDGCIAYHARALARLGAARAEVVEAIGTCVYMGGGPALMDGAKALEAFDAFADAG